MKRYTVTDRGPLVICIDDEATGKRTEYCLRGGDTVELPEEAPAVKNLLARKMIAELKAPGKPKK